MKKLLALFLLASSVFAQQQVQPVAGVLTLNLVPGTSSFKVILSANVTSVVILNPTPGTIISVIFTENATGGFTVAFGGNIANPCTVVTTANTTTTCQFQFDATSNTWNGIGGGGGSGAVSTGQQIYAAASTYGAKFDARWTNDAVLNSTNVVTSSTAHFLTNATAGQVVWAISDPAGLSGTVVLPIGTISSVDSDTQIHASTTATATQTALLFWGTDDGNALNLFWQDVINNNKGQTCGILPSSNAITSRSLFTDSTATRRFADCLYSPGFFTLIVSPSMNWAGCPAGGCFWNHPIQIAVQQPNSDYIANIEVWGGGHNWSGLGATNSIFQFQRTTVSNVWAWGIGASSSLTGMTFSGPVQVFESVVFDVNTGCSTSNAGGNGTVALYASFCGGVSGANLSIASGGALTSLGSQYGPNSNGSGISNQGRLDSYGDVFIGTTGFTVTTGSGGITYLNGSEVNQSGSGATALLIQAGGTVISNGATKISASGGGGANAILQQGTGTFRSDGNTIISSGVTNIAPTCAMTTGGGTGPACAPVAGSTNEKGTIRMTPGTTPGATGTTTLTFAGTFTGTTGTTPSCNFNYANTGTGAWSLTTTTPIVMTTRSSTAPVFNWNQTGALTAASTYDIDYVCVPR